MIKKKFRNICLVSVLGITAFAGVCSYDAGAGSNIHIINVSYDPTRELYESYNEIFKEHWKEKTGQDVDVIQSHRELQLRIIIVRSIRKFWRNTVMFLI